MRSRYITAINLFLLTILLGVWIAYDEKARGLAASLRGSLSKKYSTSEFWSQVSNFFGSLANNSAHFWYLSQTSKELLFFGSIGLLGIIITGLAIRRGRKITYGESQMQSLLKDLVQEKEKAQNLARLKSEFLNQVSHELRTPLAVIMGYLECMIDGLYGQIDAKHKEILKVVSKQSNDLKYMIDHILVFSRLEASKSRVRAEDFHISKIVADFMETYDFLGRQKGIEMSWDLPEEIPTVRSDPERFREILSNLLQNALKYTDQGSVCVGIHYQRATDSITLEVADTGIGIPRDSLATIFDPFVQVNMMASQKTRGGIGLGLSIVKKHVEELKGTIKVESDLGKGTTFRITLPRIHQEDQGRRKTISAWMKRLRGNGVSAATRANGVAGASGTSSTKGAAWPELNP